MLSLTIESQVFPTITLTGSSFLSGISSDLKVALRVPALKPSTKLNKLAALTSSVK